MQNCSWTCPKCHKLYKFICDDDMSFKCTCGEYMGTSEPTPEKKPRPKKLVPPKTPKWVEKVRAHRIDSDRGIGDTVERLIAKFGGRQFKAMMNAVGLPCGCGNRQAKLNKRYPYTD